MKRFSDIIGKNQLIFALQPYFFFLHLVLKSDVPEEVAHALLVVDPPDALRQQDRDVHGLLQRGILGLHGHYACKH